ncbi:hypothetical protein BGW39_010602 [Mortierella sp. 14UC]|nr:hypothetical protein BGW39_010602 [Mortierella sp. 14UC]
MILETPAETPAETPLMILEASAGTPELTNSTLWVAPNSSRTIWEPSSFQNADDAPVALAVADPEPDDGYKAFTPMPYMPLLPHPLITTTTKTLRSPQTYHGDEAPIISTSLYSGHIDTPPAPKLNTREFHHALFNAEDGDTEFQVKLGDMYLETKDSRHNEAALGWFLKAAQQGDPNAQTRAGIMFMYGQGTPLSYSKAMTWFLKAAKNGHATAQCNIGCLYHEGHGVDQLYSKAMEWYLRAAEQGFPEAQTKIGTMVLLNV